MASISRFEDIQAWQKARVLVFDVYEITNSGLFARDFGLRDQIRRASVSSMTNIVEGYSRMSNRDFARFLDIASSSASEVRSLLYVALDQKYIAPETFQK
ncbi:MAG TPA: four helix bundle protein, partial [Candidatus Kapabacteria bacterium]